VSSVVGEPSSSAVADLGTLEPRRDQKGRVAGRVVDERGDPVADAHVRIADGSLNGGRVIEATTDRAGGFTLNGLRPGSTYDLIAEYEGQGGLVSGRTTVRSPESDVEIALQFDDGPSNVRRAGRAPASRKVSESQPIEDDRTYRTNQEDIPASSDVEDIDDLAGSSPKQKRSGSVPVSGTGWRKSQAIVSDPKEKLASSSAVADVATRRVSARLTMDEESDVEPAPRAARVRHDDPPDDEENPLPPALDPDATREPPARRPRVPEEPAENSKPQRRTSQVNPKSPGPPPGALALAKDIPPLEKAPREPSKVARREVEPSPLEQSRFPVKSRSTWADMSNLWAQAPDLDAPAAPNRKPTQPLRQVSARDDKPATVQAAGRIRETQGSAASRDAEEACRYDSLRRQLIDFRLPDLDGRSITMKDFDSDFILLDFWGTWCRPCLNSVPHLVELQKRFGAKSLSVVGIACEDGPASASIAHVDDVAQQLGINYLVLVSTKDGASPIQEAMHIQAYPTMILLDRQGRVVWRDTGANTSTLARLDRVLEASTRALAKADVTRR
jgi:thiol-disulfide isomerase/thioredoxin